MTVFLGIFISLFVIYPTIHVGLAFILAFSVSIFVGAVFTKLIRAYQIRRDAAYLAAKREEEERRTEKAIAEMKARETERF